MRAVEAVLEAMPEIGSVSEPVGRASHWLGHPENPGMVWGWSAKNPGKFIGFSGKVMLAGGYMGILVLKWHSSGIFLRQTDPQTLFGPRRPRLPDNLG